MKLDIIAGARPNFVKIAPIIAQINKLAKDKISYRLVHTGQHYDYNMSDCFFAQLGIPKPDINLGVGSGTQAQQTAKIMECYEEVLLKDSADMVLVVGDVTSTMACSIVAKKLGTKVIHVEGGIRSHDEVMPEEINRMVTDAITDIFYTTSQTANDNLRKLGHCEKKVRFVGNVMIDTLHSNLNRLRKPKIWQQYKLKPQRYFVLTLHRPRNVDNERHLHETIAQIIANSKGMPIVFPAHPRTATILRKINAKAPNLHIIEPLGYLEFNYLVKNASAVITDSGGISEETTVLSVPCLTLRDNTERPETVTIGTNELVGTDPANIAQFMERLHKGDWKKGDLPPLWDGKSSERIVFDLLKL